MGVCTLTDTARVGAHDTHECTMPLFVHDPHGELATKQIQMSSINSEIGAVYIHVVIDRLRKKCPRLRFCGKSVDCCSTVPNMSECVDNGARDASRQSRGEVCLLLSCVRRPGRPTDARTDRLSQNSVHCVKLSNTRVPADTPLERNDTYTPRG